MQVNLMSLTNPRWANKEQTMIDCDITIDAFGDEIIPFTASQNDVESHGRAIFSDIVNGAYGPISDYVPPVDPPNLILPTSAKS